jgi:hypothetical protein
VGQSGWPYPSRGEYEQGLFSPRFQPDLAAAYSQAEVQALRDKCEELADDVRALSALLHTVRTGVVNAGLLKGGT